MHAPPLPHLDLRGCARPEKNPSGAGHHPDTVFSPCSSRALRPPCSAGQPCSASHHLCLSYGPSFPGKVEAARAGLPAPSLTSVGSQPSTLLFSWLNCPCSCHRPAPLLQGSSPLPLACWASHRGSPGSSIEQTWPSHVVSITTGDVHPALHFS